MFHEIVTAYSTVLLAVIALLLPFVPTWQDSWRRPKLEVKVGKVEPHCILPWDKEKRFSYDMMLIRIEVCNKGRREAKNTWIRLQRYFYFETGEQNSSDSKVTSQDPGWHLLFGEPTNLKWSGSGDLKQVSIPTGSELFAELFEYRIKPKNLEFRTSEPIIGNPGPHRALGRHLMEVTFGAEGAKPITKSLEFTISFKEGFECIKLCEAPTQYSGGGFLAMIESLMTGSSDQSNARLNDA